MLVIPIVNRGRILNIRFRLKYCRKVKEKVKFDDIHASDIVVNNISFSTSSYQTEQITASVIMKFIRNHSIMNKNSFYVSTKKGSDSDFYDIYEINYPLNKITDSLDDLIGSVILDLKNEIPGREKGRYIDFDKMRITDHITNEKLEKLSFVANHVDSHYHDAIVENDLQDLIDTLNFLNLFDCEVIEKSSIKVEEFQKILKFLSTIHSKDFRGLSNYYDIALANQEAYSKISRLYHIVYNDSFNWIKSNKDKVKIKTPVVYKDVA